MSISKPPINPKTIFCYDKQLHLIIQSNFWKFNGKYVRVFANNKMSKIVFFRNHSYFFSLEECQKYIAKKQDNFTIDRFPKLFKTPKIKNFMSKEPTKQSKGKKLALEIMSKYSGAEFGKFKAKITNAKNEQIEKDYNEQMDFKNSNLKFE